MTNESLKMSSSAQVEIDSPLADLLLDHLSAEKSSLTAMLTAVRDVHYALLVLDDEALKRSLEAESRELNSNTSLQARRRQVQSELAARLQLDPQEITLRRLAKITSGPLQDSINQVLNSLAEMAAEVDRLNRQNAAMIGQSLAVARGVIEQLTGSVATSESYNSIGGRAETHVGPLMQWGG